MRISIASVVFFSICSGFLVAQNGKQNTVPLDKAIAAVKDALDDYQAISVTVPGGLPAIQKADFSFKTTSKKSGSTGFTILIFTFGVNKEADDTSELKFSYAVPQPKKGGLESRTKQESLREKLVDLLLAAGTAAKENQKLGDIPLKSVTVNVSYGVTWGVDASGKAVIQLVTLNLAGSYSKNTVQTVALTFGGSN